MLSRKAKQNLKKRTRQEQDPEKRKRLDDRQRRMST